jgi:hypothetical protein
VPQAVEVDVRTAVDGDERTVAAVLARNVALDARNRERTGRLRDGAVVLEDVLDRCAISSVLTGSLRRRTAASRNVSSPTRRTATPSAKMPTRSNVTRRPSRSESCMLAASASHADDAHLRIERLHVGRDSGDEPAAADRHEYRIERTGC